MVSKIKRGRFLILFLLITGVALVLYAGDIYSEISQAMRLYDKAYRQLVVNYLDPIHAEKLTEVTIRKMLEELDPYTVFLTDDENEPIRTMARGNYGGVGLQISKRSDTLTVISPIDMGPAKRAGIFANDKIVKVDSISTIGLSLDSCAKLIRGKVGTKVDLTVIRFGVSGESVYELKREKIQVKDVSYAGFLKEGVGYIKLTGFSRGASSEIRQSLNTFTKEGDLSALILDLRGNSGGLLAEALAVSELFTQPGDTLLLTRGKTEASNKVFTSKISPAIPSEVKLAVLVDRGSASASEIVAGVVQDLDRGVVLGYPSFGKGLVQTVYRLDKEHSVKITTAKYYIPSGRLIQKPEFIRNLDLVDESAPTDTVFYSRNGRKLAGGGGIKPDFEVESQRLPKYVRELWRQNMFYQYAQQYRKEKGEDGLAQLNQSELLEDFRDFLARNDFEYQTDEEEELRAWEKKIRKDKDIEPIEGGLDSYYRLFTDIKAKEYDKHPDLILQAILGEIGTIYDGPAGRVLATYQHDKVIMKAFQVLRSETDYTVTLGYAD